MLSILVYCSVVVVNRYLLGAGTVSSDSADKETLDSGLVFGMLPKKIT